MNSSTNNPARTLPHLTETTILPLPRAAIEAIQNLTQYRQGLRALKMERAVADMPLAQRIGMLLATTTVIDPVTAGSVAVEIVAMLPGADEPPAGFIDRKDLPKLGNCRAELWAAPPAVDAVPVFFGAPAAEWRPITAPGQVNVGDRMRFMLGDDMHSVRAKLILNQGTDKEEIIYARKNNYYIITSMAVAGRGSQKEVEFLSAKPSPKPPLTDDQIAAVWESLGGLDGWLKKFGFNQFARAIEAAAAQTAGSAA